MHFVKESFPSLYAVFGFMEVIYGCMPTTPMNKNQDYVQWCRLTEQNKEKNDAPSFAAYIYSHVLYIYSFFQDMLALKELYAQRPAKEECINDPTNPKHYWRFRKWEWVIYMCAVIIIF